MRFDFPLLAEIGRIDRTDDGAVDVTDIDPRRTKEGRFLLLVWWRSARSE
jgi:hypothetical protein